MKKKLLCLMTIGLVILSCQKKTSEDLMTVSGTIEGLKKGQLYLQKVIDSNLVSVDSIEFRGNGDFTFSLNVEEPEVFYLYLEKADNNSINDRITFFGEKGEINVQTAWNTFEPGAEITGSNSHEKYMEFQDMLSKFNLVDLELMQEGLKEGIQADSLKADSLIKLSEVNLRRKYRYIINYAFNNLDTPVTPYLMLSQAKDANPKYLDSIVRSLPDSIAQTKYGKALRDYVAKL
ncbi:DUF4369 domain-containing protein [Croceivirga thetidis]|uniref:DUF4369 domain-containing protein n=1 Tax=Croceivirga thetidis TaxID=2721623 RepID=A0ABX1GU08_9FLAO|nr:DUF4369 domain-containing protein [Croceivirga thetidis]NKI33442.1 DUF4369 domain-containing protein [Croceivirga thetidis]